MGGNKELVGDYETVDSRIKRFYSEYPTATITTELAHHTPDFRVVIFKASIFINNKLVANGHAEESKFSTDVNRHCHVENAETSAIGRALANIGMNGKLRPTKEEMNKVKKYNDNEKKQLEQQKHPKGDIAKLIEMVMKAQTIDQIDRIEQVASRRSWTTQEIEYKNNAINSRRESLQ